MKQTYSSFLADGAGNDARGFPLPLTMSGGAYRIMGYAIIQSSKRIIDFGFTDIVACRGVAGNVADHGCDPGFPGISDDGVQFRHRAVARSQQSDGPGMLSLDDRRPVA
ncbi:hypothetical protein JUN65_15110 [Gluconacetobacter azotocaptans]|uniref:hypothetical protein n=1 Tax=Gluconacetobacter azotocaptans TaxID=142834 RepID=UPI00195C6C48|nr:hypothetical protein [Gluconacetobacter azotocaptans]MBM9402905.1 hypothetical protein [Gluconacetobacter azotocaptans]